jgi:hypothetical protein
LGKGFVPVAVRSRIIAGTVFGEHDFLIMSVELAPGIAIVIMNELLNSHFLNIRRREEDSGGA